MLLHHVKESPDVVPESFLFVQQVQKDTGAAIHAGDMEMFSVARQVVPGVSCDACKTFLTSHAVID
jgi:hypothetical protein